jgi:hypothetical protein
MKRNKLEQVIELWKQGSIPAEIVRKTGLSKSYVYKICSDYKNKPKSKPKAKTIVLSESELRLAASLAMARGEKIRMQPADDMVNSPPHYTAGGIETIDFIEAKELNYHLGNVVKYVTRSGHKGDKLKDLEKAQWYLNRAINNLKK